MQNDATINALFEYNYNDLSIPMQNTSINFGNQFLANPWLTLITIGFKPNLTGIQKEAYTPGVGAFKRPCTEISPALAGFGHSCECMLYIDQQSDNVQGYLFNPTTGTKLTPTLVVQKSSPVEVEYEFFRDQLTPQFFLNYIQSNVGVSWNLQYASVYYPSKTDTSSARLVAIGLDCILAVSVLFDSLTPSPNAHIFLLDDQGLMVASSGNQSTSNGSVRYNIHTNNSDALVLSLGQLLYSQYGAGAATNVLVLPNTTLNFFSVGGTTYILATKNIYMPVSNQVFVMKLDRDFVWYCGSRDNPCRGSGISGVVSAAQHGKVYEKRKFSSPFLDAALIVALFIFPQLTKFDFSVLESGTLESKSRVSELHDVESSFLEMVKAFANAIKRNKELKTRNPATTASSFPAVSSNIPSSVHE
ncbi:hypothetical protein HDU82_005190 [Entophlyctis luteolus]|nr:hypothetical protein HDU82_005190 [Entophlyctis luteolus]